MRTSKRILKALAVLMFAFLVNYALCVALVPYGSKSEIMWTDLRQTGDLDMVFLGTSLVERSVNPNVIDEALGTESFNMATPSQSLEDTYLGVEEAIREHHVKRVIIGVEFSDLSKRSASKAGVFVREKAKGESPWEALHDLMRAIDADTWLNDPIAFSIILFPWQIQHVAPSRVKSNVTMKFDGTSVYDAAKVNEPGWTYYGKGFGSYTGVYSYVVSPSKYYVNDYDLSGLTEFSQDRLQILTEICELCEENGVELIIFVDPLADFHIVSFGEKYEELSGWLRDFALSHGAQYWDFNLAKPELFENSKAYYNDYQHMNLDGANALSAAFVILLKRLDEGGSTDDLFCSYEERVARVDTIASANFVSTTRTEKTIEIEATAVAGPDVKVEYRFSARYVEGGEEQYAVIQDYSPSQTCSFEPSERGLYLLRLEVREAGSEKAAISAARRLVF